jgi:hypothetical protein
MLMLPNTVFTPHVGANEGNASPSWRIASHLGQGVNPDGSYGWIYFEDDFEGYNACTATGTFGKAPYYAFMDGGGVASLTTDLGGVVQASSGANADDDISFSPGHVAGLVKLGVGSPGAVTGMGGKVIFEARIRAPSVTDGDGSWFVGLSGVGMIANNGFISDAHAVSGGPLLGFWVVDSDNDRMNFGYNVNAGTAQVSAYSAITAATFVKVGFVYDPSAPSANRLTWYVDGVAQEVNAAGVSAYVSGTTIGERVGKAGSAAFPAGIQMSPALDVKTDAGAAFRLDIDWWYVGMQRLS